MKTAEEIILEKPINNPVTNVGYYVHPETGPLDGWRLAPKGAPGIVQAPHPPGAGLYKDPDFAFYPLAIRYGREEWDEARAKAIVAVPQLVAALEAILEFADNGTPIHPGALVLDDARKALKAAGVRQ